MLPFQKRGLTWVFWFIIIYASLGLLKFYNIWGNFSADYGELLCIIEENVVSAPLSIWLIIESDSVLAVNCLFLDGDDLLELGALASHFLNSIDTSNTIFSHVYQTAKFLGSSLSLTCLTIPCSPRMDSWHSHKYSECHFDEY